MTLAKLMRIAHQALPDADLYSTIELRTGALDDDTSLTGRFIHGLMRDTFVITTNNDEVTTCAAEILDIAAQDIQRVADTIRNHNHKKRKTK